MSYFPLDVINELNNAGVMENLIDAFLKNVSEETGKEVKADDDFFDYVFSQDFFDPYYDGKYKVLNDYLLYNKELNRVMLKGVKFMDILQRKTEWRDLFGEVYVLSEWSKSKIVYKIDNDFFHEIKNTGNLKFSRAMFKYLPVHTMYFDLSDVKGISAFKGAWVNIYQEGDKDNYLFTIYMVTEGTDRDDVMHAFFSYYCGFRFNDDTEAELDLKEVVSGATETFHINDYRTFDEDGVVIRQSLDRNDDHRGEIIIAVMQILQFLHAQIEDITESSVTKATYKPSPIIKNKFSEVRMWDVGVRYGKAIRFAKEQVEKETKLCDNETNSEKKARKPMRPHIRSAHWQRYHVGEGRKDIKIVWIPPVYVCGGKEIAVTIHKVS